MQDSQKKKLAWAGIILVIILLLIFVWLLGRPDQLGDSQSGNTNDAPKFTPKSTELEYQPITNPAETDTEFSVLSLAKSYAERFGSWSTDNQGNNLRELRPLSTSSMKAYLNSVEPNYENSEFSGISTKSISTKMQSLTDDEATIIVKTQRIETRADNSKNTYYQDIEIELVNSGGAWLVDGARWQ